MLMGIAEPAQGIPIHVLGNFSTGDFANTQIKSNKQELGGEAENSGALCCVCGSGQFNIQLKRQGCIGTFIEITSKV